MLKYVENFNKLSNYKLNSGPSGNCQKPWLDKRKKKEQKKKDT